MRRIKGVTLTDVAILSMAAPRVELDAKRIVRERRKEKARALTRAGAKRKEGHEDEA